MVQKIQQEKERVNEQSREKMGEFEIKWRKLESERIKREEEISKILREKESQIESLKS